jgi:uncharacterized protein (DUF1501 family)
MTTSDTNFKTTAFTRREFLGAGLTLASAAATIPAFLERSAFGLPMPAPGCSSIPGTPEDHILVVIQLSGGNDGLNTVIPFGQAAYYKARTSIAIPQDKVLRLGGPGSDGIGLHPAMRGLKELHEDGLLAIVQGVGYPNPNRSHFKSMDIWHTADTSATGHGWLGRYIDAECCGYGKGESGTPEPQAAIAIGREAPLALQGAVAKPIAFENTDLFRWLGHDVHASLAEPYERITRRGAEAPAEAAAHGPNSNAAFLMRTALDAQVSSEQIRRAVAQRPLVQYPAGDLGRQLRMVAAMIRSGLRTRVYYVTMGGFDTHAGQGGENGRHAQLLGQFAGALRAFYSELKEQGDDGRVLTLSFSEFGRRVGQNASGGTDHGTAAPMFLAGPMVRPGLLGAYPSLTDLDEGDLKYTTDFRAVYGGVLSGWLGADPRKVLDVPVRPMTVVRKA